MVWRSQPALTPDEARQLHYEALVIDTQQPPITYGMVFTERMRQALQEFARQGRSREEVQPILEAMACREVQTSDEVRRRYLDLWKKSGVTVACGTYSGPGPISQAFERAVRRIAQAYAITEALNGEVTIVKKAADIERVHREGKHGIILDFQDTIAFADDLDRIDLQPVFS